MLNPELKNKTVAVCGSVEERHGIVLAKNYAAKAFGVSTGEEMCIRDRYETAMRFTKGKHAFIVATHVDRAHIHNHIIFNSTTLDLSLIHI